MSHSASADQTTTRLHHPTKWEMPGLAKLGICSMAAGLLALAWVFIEGRDSTTIHILSVAQLALAVTLLLGGLQAIRWGVSAQKGREREQLFVGDLAAIEQGQSDLGKDLGDPLRTLAERLTRLERNLREALEVTADQLAAIEQGATAITRAVRETADQQSSEASRLEVRLEVLYKQLQSVQAGQDEIRAALAALSLQVPNKEEIVAEVREQLKADMRAEIVEVMKELEAEQKKRAPRQRSRRTRRTQQGEAGENVIPLRARRAADALRRLEEHINDSTDK